MGFSTIIPEANEWVQTVIGIDGRGGTAKQWRGQQLRPGSHVVLDAGTLCLVVNSSGMGSSRREWIELITLDVQGVRVELARTSKTWLVVSLRPVASYSAYLRKDDYALRFIKSISVRSRANTIWKNGYRE
jgi:hypothetical protein